MEENNALETVRGAAEMLAARPEYVVQEPEAWKGRWSERFGNDHPIHIEIGMGKGQFITGMAADILKSIILELRCK